MPGRPGNNRLVIIRDISTKPARCCPRSLHHGRNRFGVDSHRHCVISLFNLFKIGYSSRCRSIHLFKHRIGILTEILSEIGRHAFKFGGLFGIGNDKIGPGGPCGSHRRPNHGNLAPTAFRGICGFLSYVGVLIDFFIQPINVFCNIFNTFPGSITVIFGCSF